MKEKKITCGEIDKDGFAETFVDNEKTNVKVLLFSKESVEKLYEYYRNQKNEKDKL